MKRKTIVKPAKLGDTFRLNQKLTARLQDAARRIGATPEWVVAQALDSFITSVATDSTFCGDMSHNHSIDLQNKTKCIVQPVEGGAR